jgi:hypothetical protein
MQRQFMRQMQKMKKTGGGGNPVQMMQQKMQAELAAVQEELEEATVEGVAGGGAVQVVMTGGQEISSVKVSKEVVDPEDVEMLEDLILVAVKDALEKSRALSAERMGRITSGLNLPPGLF